MGGLSARVTGLNFYLGSTILTAGALGLSVQAQEASPDDTWALEEVIVTAQRREESLNKVPIAVTAFSGDMLEKTSVTELTDIAGLTPGLYLSSYSTLSPQIFIRGIGSNDDGITAEGAVGVYLDDIYVGRASSALFDLFDLERLEVLKGPQGTLYGRNTNGGAINIITRKPDNETTGAFKATYGNYDALQLQGFVSAPFIEDRLYGKVSVSLKKRDGWTTDSISGNKVNDEDSLSLRGQLRFTPTDMLDAIVSMDYSRDRTTSSYKEVVFGSFFGFAPAESPDRFEGAYDLPDAKTDRNILGLSAKVTLDTDAVIYTSITGYRTMDLEYTEDYDSTPLPLVGLETTQDTKQFTQELRAASNTDSPLQWIAGLFYLHDTGEAFDLIDLGELYVGFPDEVTNSDTLTNSYAAFGEASYRLSDKLKATAGLRYTHEEKEFTVERFNPAGSVALVGFESVGIPSTTATDSFSELSPKFVLDYQVTDNTLIYAGITMGFKSGGFNNFPFDTATAQVAFDPETITSYETGLKSTLLEGRMQLNVSAFFYDYNNLQVRTVVSSGGIEVPQIRNAAKAEVYGGEMALTARVTPELQLEVTYGFLDTKYKDFAGFSGNRLTRAPKHSFSAALDYAREAPTLDGTFIFRADYNYTSKIYFSPKQIDILSQDGFGLVNLRMAFEHESGWSIAAYGKNLANETYNGHVIDLLDFDLAFAEIGAPRQYGLSLSYHF